MKISFAHVARRHPGMTSAGLCFVALSAVELLRLALLGGPVSFEAGVYDWETTPAAAGEPSLRYRWTGAEAKIGRPVRGNVLVIPLFVARPDLDGNGVRVSITANGRSLDNVEASGQGWREGAYYLPPILGAIHSGGSESSGHSVGNHAVPWQELRPWRRPQGYSLALDIVVGSTFVPRDFNGSPDGRNLGVGLGEFVWRDGVGPEGVGFHEWESDGSGHLFRWTSRLWASQPLTPPGMGATIDLRVGHPDISQQPVRVEVFWNETLIREVAFSTHEWTAVSLPAQRLGVEPGVLSVFVDRTWNPLGARDSTDKRELGVAVASVRVPSSAQ